MFLYFDGKPAKGDILTVSDWVGSGANSGQCVACGLIRGEKLSWGYGYVTYEPILITFLVLFLVYFLGFRAVCYLSLIGLSDGT